MTRPEDMSREDLEEEVTYLRSELGLITNIETHDAIRSAFGLIPVAVSALMALYAARGRPMSLEQIQDTIPNKGRDDTRTNEYIKALICRVRKGVGNDAVRTLWGVGYALTPEGIAKIDAILPARKAA